MKIYNSINFLGVLALIILISFNACGKEAPKKQIYGKFAGEVARIDTRISTSEQTYELTESAILTLTQTHDGMKVVISGEKITQEIQLLDPKVSGNKNYQYTYKTDDGSVEVKILSPDFDNVTLTAILLLADIDLKVVYAFKGQRIESDK